MDLIKQLGEATGNAGAQNGSISEVRVIDGHQPAVTTVALNLNLNLNLNLKPMVAVGLNFNLARPWHGCPLWRAAI
ncbi:hypothetical protein [Belnapia rosea]|uniref:hypothetical protein n=1 Tax=Belnapia rosea TaxID=938405 RepID=UPI000B87F38A|nr:hypothetical protein [Belnapia rosea]